MCSWSFGENSLAHHLQRRQSGGRKRTPLFDKACTSAPVAGSCEGGSREGASQTPIPLKREQGARMAEKRPLATRWRPDKQAQVEGHSSPKILALLPDFSQSSLRLLGLRPNLYLVPSTPGSLEILGWGVAAARVHTAEICPRHELPRSGPVGRRRSGCLFKDGFPP